MTTTINASTSAGLVNTADTSGVLELQTAGTTAVTVDASQNVGIGTASPATKLHVSSGAATITGAASTTGRINIFNNAATSGGFLLGQGFASGTDNIAYVYNTSSAAVVFGTADLERMRIDSSGNVGIGTSSPAYKLDVNGIIRGRSDQYFGFVNGSQAGVWWAQTNYAVPSFQGLTSAGNVGDIVMQLGGGNLLVGATAAINGALLTVQNSGGSGIATGYGTTASQWRRMYVNTSNQNLYFYNGNNEGYLSSAGSWTNASDARLKTNIRTIEYGLNTVLELKPRHFERVDVDGTYIGFVAQELQAIIPEVVSGDPERQLGVDYGSLVAVAFKAIQEQQALITQLQADVAALKGATP